MTKMRKDKLKSVAKRSLGVFFLVFVALGFMFTSVFAEAFYPADSVLSSTCSVSGLQSFINHTRDESAEYPYAIQNFSAGKPSCGKVFDTVNQQTAIGATFTANNSGKRRVFIQMNESFYVSDAMIAATKTSGTYTPVVNFSQAFTSPDIYVNTTHPGFFVHSQSGLMECWIYFDRIPSSTYGGDANLRYRSVCRAQSSWVSGFDSMSVYLTKNGVVLTTLASCGSGSCTEGTSFAASGLTPIGLNNYTIGYAPNVAFGTNAEYSLPVTRIGARQDRVAEQSVGVYANAVQIIALARDQENSLFLTSLTYPPVNYKHKLLYAYNNSLLPGTLFSDTPSGSYTAFMTVIENTTVQNIVNNTQFVSTAKFNIQNQAKDIQVGTFFNYIVNLTTPQPVVRCPTVWYVLSGVQTDVDCGQAGLTSSTKNIGEISASQPATELVNGTLWAYSASSQTEIKSMSVRRTVDGSIVTLDSSNLPDSFRMLNIPSRTTSGTETYLATLVSNFGSTYTQAYPIQYIVTDTLPSTQQNNAQNHKVLFFASKTNSTGTFMLENATVTFANATTCTTQARLVDNLTFSYCSFYVPNSLTAYNTTYKITFGNTTYNKTLEQVYYGTYASDTFVDFGVAENSLASVWYVNFDETNSRWFITSDIFTCKAAQVGIQTIDSDDICKARSCPLSWTLSDVQGTSISPYDLTCLRGGQVKCVLDSVTKTAYVATCGSSCEVSSRLCPTYACNSDASGCANEQTVAEQDDALSDFFASSPLANFLINEHIDFTIGFILVAGLTVFLFLNVGPLFAGIVGIFGILGLIVLTLPNGFLILLLAAAIVTLVALVKLYGGNMGVK